MPGVLGGDVRIELLAEGDAWVSTGGMDAYDTPQRRFEDRRLRARSRRLIRQQGPGLHLHRRNLQRSYCRISPRPEPTRLQQPPNNLPESADDRPRVSQRFMPMDFDSLNENRRLLRCESRGPLARGEMRECSEAASLLKGTWGFPFRLAPNSFGKGTSPRLMELS